MAATPSAEVYRLGFVAVSRNKSKDRPGPAVAIRLEDLGTCPNAGVRARELNCLPRRGFG